MMHVREVLNKIKCDKKENPELYKIYYYDRVLDKLIEIDYKDIKDIDKNFITIMKNNKETEIPMHRIKEVRKQGKLIWSRTTAS